MSEAIHFCGLIPGGPADERLLRQRLGTLLRPVGFGAGSLAAGADIAVTEVLLEQGAEVVAVLPFPEAAFIETSVRIGGEAWVPRFEACLARVRLEVLRPAHTDDIDYAAATARAMQLARLRAPNWQLAVWDGPRLDVVAPASFTAGAAGSGAAGLNGGGPRATGSGEAGTAADIRRWAEAGGRTVVVPSPWRKQ